METWVVWMGDGCRWWQGARSDPGASDTSRCLVVGNSEASSVDDLILAFRYYQVQYI